MNSESHNNFQKFIQVPGATLEQDLKHMVLSHNNFAFAGGTYKFRLGIDNRTALWLTK